MCCSRVLYAVLCCAVLCCAVLCCAVLCCAVHLCSEAEAWLNDPEVRQALHAAPSETTGKWVICSDRIDYTSDGGSMLPVHTQLTRGWGETQLAGWLGRAAAVNLSTVLWPALAAEALFFSAC
jgi:hypothetical protein